MGTDIHAVFQARKDGKWIDVPSEYEERRHYALFAWLANVRNGYGFAGVPTHTAIKPLLLEPNGFPADFEEVDGYHPMEIADIPKWLHSIYDDDNADKLPDGRVKRYIADHTPCHLTAEQILEGDRPATLKRVGVVNRAFYEKWNGTTPPDSWSGGISGHGIVVVDQPPVREQPYGAPSLMGELPREATHVNIRFETPDGFDYFVDEVRRLKELHGEVRMVFGFDS